ncbi:lysine--tRNA ligase [Candidatus Roizmanbacteria bacterium]|nr:lysine--tRNA ligase [Candidatus Roizmanbacteria bacterium]
MIWVDREVKNIKKRELPLEWVDDMKTPSGRIHVGSLRGVVIHDLVYKVLLENGVKTKYTYVFDDHDPMDSIPSYLDYEKWEKYAGMQLYKIPSPVKGYKSFAQYYAKEFQDVFESINCHPQIIWASDLYNLGKMNGVIREVLDNADKIRSIYRKVLKVKQPRDWHPFNVVCTKCKKIGTTSVYKWDGRYVYYRCKPQMVAWARGCGNEGKISPFNGKGKMSWKIDWAAKWKVIGVTVEGAGKDHMSAGGSHDIASEVVKKVFRYAVPYPVGYEFFIIGGRKMSSSKGVGASAKEVSEILPPDILRFLLVRTPIERTLDFDPYGDAILNLFDDYDRCMSAYFDKLEKKLPEGKQGEVLSDFARIIELSAVRPLPQARMFLPRFRTIVNLSKTKTHILKFFEEQKGSSLTSGEKEMLEERVVYTQVYLKEYARDDIKIQLTEKSPKRHRLTREQKEFLRKLNNELSTLKTRNREKLQEAIFELLNKNGFQAKEAFRGLYQVLLGRDYGPKAADLILEFGIKKVSQRLKDLL